MHWNDKAIILSTRKHGESSGIVSLLTRDRGMHKGLVRGVSSKKTCGTFQIGNLIDANWRGRLAEHLGNYTAEVISPNAAFLLRNPLKLAALSSICTMFDQTLAEREQCYELFQLMHNLIQSLTCDEPWQQQYALLELELLSHLGFGLDLTECAATGSTKELTYISPKSGRAVCRTAGKPYKNKLFSLPKFFISGLIIDENKDDIINGLNICAYFLEKYVLTQHNVKLPVARLRLTDMIKKSR